MSHPASAPRAQMTIDMQKFRLNSDRCERDQEIRQWAMLMVIVIVRYQIACIILGIILFLLSEQFRVLFANIFQCSSFRCVCVCVIVWWFWIDRFFLSRIFCMTFGFCVENIITIHKRKDNNHKISQLRLIVVKVHRHKIGTQCVPSSKSQLRSEFCIYGRRRHRRGRVIGFSKHIVFAMNAASHSFSYTCRSGDYSGWRFE